MGDFEDVERLQAGIREWLLRSARSGRHELRGIQAPAVLPLLCAAAFGPELAEASVVARIGVLSAVRADALAGVLADAVTRARSAHASGTPSRGDLQREVSRGIRQALDAQDGRAAEVRSDIAMVLREIDAGGTMLRAAIEAGDSELEREVLAVVEAVSAAFGDLEFMLADLARAAREIQDSLRRQGAELRAAGEQAGRQAADVRLIREELAVIERRTRQYLTEPGDADDPGWARGCPYRGLLPYDRAHERVFFGRERLTAELAGRLAETGLVIVTGAPGAGKTSLLQAGLLPALSRGVQVPGSAAWLTVSMAPAAHPLTELAARLAPLGGGDAAAIRTSLAEAPGEAHLVIRDLMLSAPRRAPLASPPAAGLGETPRLVLIVDQFERVFAADDTERAAFIEAVCAAAARPAGPAGEPPALAVIAVRADHWDQCAGYPQLMRVMQQNQLVVGPMTPEGLRRAITGPAEASGLRVDPALTEAILADLGAAGHERGPGLLPVLSAAMMLIWGKRDGGRLTVGSYHGAGLPGQIARAIEVAAEAVYAGLPEDTRTIARGVIRRLTTTDRDNRLVCRPATRAELRAACPRDQPSDVDAVLEALAGGHLLALDGDTAEIAHDALLQGWPRLRDWLEEDRATLVLHRQLTEAAVRWRENGKATSLLYRGVRLAAAEQAARVWQADPGRYPALADGEVGFLRASGRAAARGRRWRRVLAAALAAGVVAALAGAGLTVRSARNTADQLRTADLSGRLAAQSAALDDRDPITAALLAGAAWRIAPTAQARYSLLESLAQPARGILAAQSGTVTALAAGPGGRTLAAGYADGAVRLWDLASHRLMSTATWGTPALALAFADGGKTLELASAVAVGTWNTDDRSKIAVRPLPGSVPGAAALRPDGSMLATGGGDGNVRLWDPATQQEIGAPMSSGLRPVDAVAFSPDGKTVAAASSDGTVQLWDAATRQEAGSAIVAGAAPVKALAFSPDGKLLATGAQDGTVRLWDLSLQSQRGATMPAGGPVAALAFDADGVTLAAEESNGATELWDVATQDQTGAPLAAQGPAGVGAVTFGAAALATGNGAGAIQLWDPAVFRQVSAPLVTGGPATAGHAAVGGGILAVTDGHGTVRLWDTLTRRRIGGSLASHHVVTGLALSADGKTLAVAGDGVQLWATATGRRAGGPIPASAVAVAVSTDGRTVATVGADRTVRLWDAATGRQAGTPVSSGGTGPLSFSPDGKTLATVGRDGMVRLWDVATRGQTGRVTIAGTTPGAVAVSPDGTMLATAGASGDVRLWDIATQQQVGPAMTAGPQPVYALAFSPDGAKLAAVGADGIARDWDVAFPSRLPSAACAIAGRSLTPQQWSAYAGTQPFQQVCPAG